MRMAKLIKQMLLRADKFTFFDCGEIFKL